MGFIESQCFPLGDGVEHPLEEPLTRAINYFLSVLAKQFAELVVNKFNVNLGGKLLREDGFGVGGIKQLRHITLLVVIVVRFFSCRRLVLVSENNDVVVQVLEDLLQLFLVARSFANALEVLNFKQSGGVERYCKWD